MLTGVEIPLGVSCAIGGRSHRASQALLDLRPGGRVQNARRVSERGVLRDRSDQVPEDSARSHGQDQARQLRLHGQELACVLRARARVAWRCAREAHRTKVYCLSQV